MDGPEPGPGRRRGRGPRRLVAEAGRFLTVGAVATLVSFVLFNLLVHGPVGPVPLRGHAEAGYVLANLVGMLVSFAGLKRWAFRHRETSHADGGFVAYAVINVVTMALPVGCLWIRSNLLGLSDPVADNVAANVVGLGLGNAARFVLFRSVVLDRREPRERVGSDA